MSFTDSIDTRSDKKTFQKTLFLDLPNGQHLIRLLESSPTKIYAHYINNTYVKCLGDICPICMKTTRVVVDNPKDYRTMKGFSPKSQRFYVNVLDKTPVKVCPSCGKENKKISGKFAPTCTCGAFFPPDLREQPSNKVKLWGFGVTVATKFAGFEEMFKESGTELNSFDFTLMVAGEDKKDVMPVPMPQNNEVVNVPVESLYKPESGIIVLDGDELVQFQNGVQLRDIFAARRNTAVETKLNEESKMSAEDVQKTIDELFGK